jgi:hypothetical protein
VNLAFIGSSISVVSAFFSVHLRLRLVTAVTAIPHTLGDLGASIRCGGSISIAQGGTMIHALTRTQSGASPVSILLTVAVVALLALMLRDLVGSGDETDATAAESQAYFNPMARAAEAQAKADSVDAQLREMARLAREDQRDLGYGPIKEPEPVDGNTLFQLEVMISDGEGLMRRGRSSALRIPEADADAGLRTRQASAATQQWIAWVRSWDQETNNYGRRLARAAEGLGFDNPAYMVYQELNFFVNELRRAGVNNYSTTNIPPKSQRESNFDSAEWRLGEARNRLAKLRAGN